MNLFALAYGAGVRARNALYQRGALRARTLGGPVVSVGNLSVGGSGKTPFVLLLGRLLRDRGVGFDVLSRGYGRQTKGVAVVDPTGSPRDFGDEPLLLARRLSVPVIVGEDRFRAGELAETKFGPQLHLLDDGFQHRSLARDFDIVLLAAEDRHDRLLPTGRLREPLSSLDRADAVVLTGEALPSSLPVAGKLLWRIQRKIVAHDVPARPVGFCGIARPGNFFRDLASAGIEAAAEAVFRDHHRYCQNDVSELRKLKEQSQADGFVTTEKDAINLEGYLSALQPIAVVQVQMELADAANAVDTMLRVVRERKAAA
jgi:tetraacyldisaccharide 4'-kinase